MKIGFNYTVFFCTVGNMTAKEFSKKYGFEYTSVWGWYNGIHTPKLKNIKKIAAAIGVDPKKLITIR